MPDRPPGPNSAFLDESVRPSVYLMAATLVSTTATREIRGQLRLLRAPGQRRIHFATESDRRRRSLLAAMARLPVTSVVYVARHHDHEAARAAILRRAAPDLVQRGVSKLVIESRSGQDPRDRSVLYSALRTTSDVAYEHRSPSTEPLLWIPDAVAWAWGRGGPWRPLVEAHAISEVVAVKA